jgi:23S rRNA (adenine2503-C2)-methyltransferase
LANKPNDKKMKEQSYTINSQPGEIADSFIPGSGEPGSIRTDILELTLDELKSEMSALGEKPFRAGQIYKWLYKGAAHFEEMTDLSKTLIQKLNEHYTIGTLQQLKRLVSSDNHTIKYLYLLNDDNIIECVAMKYHHGVTLCLSTQVGCAMGCSFCASTTGGLIRSLTAGEMMDQVLSVNRDLAAHGKEQIGGLVLMGSGEPLDNYANTLKFIRQIHDPKGFNMGYRNITLSTCGLVPKMRALADEGLSINLAISLHAPNDAIRKNIMRIANAYSIEDVIDASRYYFEKTGRRITFEYALIKGINDQPEHAGELSTLLKGFPCHINLIPLNENEHSSQKRSNEDSIKRFAGILESAGMNVTRRREMGLDIQGACGQLKAAYLKKEKGGHKGD